MQTYIYINQFAAITEIVYYFFFYAAEIVFVMRKKCSNVLEKQSKPKTKSHYTYHLKINPFISTHHIMFEFIYNYAEKEAVIKYLRLVIVVSFYLIFRQYYSTWAQKKYINDQVAKDEQEKLTKPERDEAARIAQEESLKKEAASFGWGKKTRNNVNTQQAILQDQLDVIRQRNQTAYDAAEDHDIEDLLQD